MKKKTNSDIIYNHNKSPNNSVNDKRSRVKPERILVHPLQSTKLPGILVPQKKTNAKKHNMLSIIVHKRLKFQPFIFIILKCVSFQYLFSTPKIYKPWNCHWSIPKCNSPKRNINVSHWFSSFQFKDTDPLNINSIFFQFKQTNSEYWPEEYFE